MDIALSESIGLFFCPQQHHVFDIFHLAGRQLAYMQKSPFSVRFQIVSCLVRDSSLATGLVVNCNVNKYDILISFG